MSCNFSCGAEPIDAKTLASSYTDEEAEAYAKAAGVNPRQAPPPILRRAIHPSFLHRIRRPRHHHLNPNHYFLPNPYHSSPASRRPLPVISPHFPAKLKAFSSLIKPHQPSSTSRHFFLVWVASGCRARPPIFLATAFVMFMPRRPQSMRRCHIPARNG